MIVRNGKNLGIEVNSMTRAACCKYCKRTIDDLYCDACGIMYEWKDGSLVEMVE